MTAKRGERCLIIPSELVQNISLYILWSVHWKHSRPELVHRLSAELPVGHRTGVEERCSMKLRQEKMLRVRNMPNIVFEDGCRTKLQRDKAAPYRENGRKLKLCRVKCPSSLLHFLNSLAVSEVLASLTINQLFFLCKYPCPYSSVTNWSLPDDVIIPNQKFLSFILEH